jgi:hypothetical protein
MRAYDKFSKIWRPGLTIYPNSETGMDNFVLELKRKQMAEFRRLQFKMALRFISISAKLEVDTKEGLPLDPALERERDRILDYFDEGTDIQTFITDYRRHHFTKGDGYAERLIYYRERGLFTQLKVEGTCTLKLYLELAQEDPEVIKLLERNHLNSEFLPPTITTGCHQKFLLNFPVHNYTPQTLSLIGPRETSVLAAGDGLLDVVENCFKLAVSQNRKLVFKFLCEAALCHGHRHIYEWIQARRQHMIDRTVPFFQPETCIEIFHRDDVESLAIITDPDNKFRLTPHRFFVTALIYRAEKILAFMGDHRALDWQEVAESCVQSCQPLPDYVLSQITNYQKVFSKVTCIDSEFPAARIYRILDQLETRVNDYHATLFDVSFDGYKEETTSRIPHNVAVLDWLKSHNKEVRYEELLALISKYQSCDPLDSILWLIRECRARGIIPDVRNCLYARMRQKNDRRNTLDEFKLIDEALEGQLDHDHTIRGAVKFSHRDVFDHFLSRISDARRIMVYTVCHGQHDMFVSVINLFELTPSFAEMCRAIKKYLPRTSREFLIWLSQRYPLDCDMILDALLSCRIWYHGPDNFDETTEECLTWLETQGVSLDYLKIKDLIFERKGDLLNDDEYMFCDVCIKLERWIAQPHRQAGSSS